MPPLVRWQYIATGRVQGVNYRARVLDAARRWGIAGEVANLSDGTVSIDAQGPPEALERFLSEVRGPAGLSDARAVRCVAELPVSPSLRTFVIVRESGRSERAR